MLFQWLSPRRLAVFGRLASVCCGQPEVMTPLLRTVQELAHNRNGRVEFDVKSADGIRLFRAVADVSVPDPFNCTRSVLLNCSRVFRQVCVTYGAHACKLVKASTSCGLPSVGTSATLSRAHHRSGVSQGP